MNNELKKYLLENVQRDILLHRGAQAVQHDTAGHDAAIDRLNAIARKIAGS